MKIDKHTPGPWVLADDGAVWQTARECQLPGSICEPSKRPTVEEENANARLIALAPEMLESLTMLVNLIERWNHALPLTQTSREVLAAWIKKARAILARLDEA